MVWLIVAIGTVVIVVTAVVIGRAIKWAMGEEN